MKIDGLKATIKDTNRMVPISLTPIRKIPDFPVVLMTSCVIIADGDAVLRAPEKRIHHTLEAIEHWIELAPDLPIVICDGSNFDFSPLLAERFPGHAFECLFFQNNAELVKKQGKGYGEGEIIAYALEHSRLLQTSSYFIKCTAKLWVENIQACLRSSIARQCPFQAKAHFKHVFSLFKKTTLDFIDTRFYFCEKNFYHTYFSSAYRLVGLSDQRSIEHVFRDIILEKELPEVLLAINPVICGVGGGHGSYYKNNLKRRLKDRLRLLVVRMTTRFQFLFPN